MRGYGHAEGDRPLPRLAVPRGRDTALLPLRPRAVRGLARGSQARARRRRRAGARGLRDPARPRPPAPGALDSRAEGVVRALPPPLRARSRAGSGRAADAAPLAPP